MDALLTLRRILYTQILAVFVWALHCSWISLQLRQDVMFFVLNFRKNLFIRKRAAWQAFARLHAQLGFPCKFEFLLLRSWLFSRSVLAGASMGNTFENDVMLLIFNATAIANLADNAATSPLTNLSVALHTADPGETGNQSTSEITYTSYARVSVARTSGGWTVTANSVSPVAAITFPAGTGGTGTATHFSIGPTGGGTTKIMFSGPLTPNIVTGNGITPSLGTGSTITID